MNKTKYLHDALNLEPLWRDVRHAFRLIRQKPGFTTLTIALLALGLGVNTATFAVAYGILVRPLPYPEPSRIVVLNLLFADGDDLGFSPDAVQGWIPRLRTVELAAAYHRREVTVRFGSRNVVIPAAAVTEQFFEVLGTPADLGRARVHTDSPHLLVGRRHLAHILGADGSQPLGLSLLVSDRTHIIGGVMPSEFAFPADDIGVWLPSRVLIPGTTAVDAGFAKIVVRLRPGVTLDQLRDDANRVRLELNPKSREQLSIVALDEAIVGDLQPILVATIAGALLVLFVACANTATMFIGRDIARQREFATRLALGASRAQLVRAIFVETALIASIALALGLVLGTAALKFFVTEASATISGLHRVGLDFSIVLAIAVLTAIVTLTCGSLSAWQVGRNDFSPFLRSTSDSRPRAWRVRRVLVIAQIALSCVLLIGAGLLARTVSALVRDDHGFQPTGALEAKIVLSDTVLFTPTQGDRFVQDLLERVRALPGVQHAGFGTSLPPRAPAITIAVRIITDERKETRFMKVGSTTPGYLRALGAQFIAGRDFHDGENRPESSVVILTESIARFYFPGENPLGRTIARLPGLFRTRAEPRVIGVVRDIKYEGLDTPAGGSIYVPWALRPLGTGYLVIRSTGDPMRLAPDVRRAAHTLNPTIPVPELQSLSELVAQSTANRRIRALPAVGFGVLATVVALVGVLGTLLTLVAERRRDLAIRSALGASPGHLARTIAAQGLSLTALGLLIGFGFGATAARALSSLLYQVSPYDAVTFLATAAVIGGGGSLMTSIAAVGARSVDPMAVLRQE